MTHIVSIRRRVFTAIASLVMAVISTSMLPAPDVFADESTAAYATAIAAAQADLDAGNLAGATDKLMSTDESKRRFEFQYLLGRLSLMTDGTPAPDLIRTIAKPDVDTRYAVLNPVNRSIVFICRDGSLRIYDLATPDAEPRVLKHESESAVWTGAFSQDVGTFVAGHQNGDVVVWNTADWTIRQTIKLGEDWPVRELAIAPDGSSVVAEAKGGLELWSLGENPAKKIARIGDRFNFGEGLAFSPVGDTIATGGMFDIQLVNAKNGEKTRSMRHASYTMGLEFSPDGTHIASAPRGNVNKFLAVFDVTKDEPKFNSGPFGHYIAGMAWSPDGDRIAATGCEKLLRLFDAATGDTILSLNREDCGSKPAMTRDGLVLGWNEPAGFLYIDLRKTNE